MVVEVHSRPTTQDRLPSASFGVHLSYSEFSASPRRYQHYQAQVKHGGKTVSETGQLRHPATPHRRGEGRRRRCASRGVAGARGEGHRSREAARAAALLRPEGAAVKGEDTGGAAEQAQAERL